MNLSWRFYFSFPVPHETVSKFQKGKLSPHLSFHLLWIQSVSSVTQWCPTLCNPMDCSMPGLPVHHQLPELTQTHVHSAGDAIQPAHPLPSPPPAFNPAQHQALFQWLSPAPTMAVNPRKSSVPAKQAETVMLSMFPKPQTHTRLMMALPTSAKAKRLH